ncbi:histone H2A deubiquitinase MYSM1-like [Macrosteles quadrilineatus]|uniref:histone H2A deubiquitinase MYSM1-like n=1 Tax=Macrosteles quadrilineatus TaxID=74068 RepID=UPI0023E119A2|nr:histone H2A deubiquitinase MYSM1-like [Macrosteles quadrilineatus]
MEDEDEIDVLGEFNLENILTNNEQITSCYDGEHQLGLNCDSSWMLDSTQSCWYNSKSEPQPSLEEFPSTFNAPELTDSNAWSEKEKYLLEKGLELFGRSYSRLSQYIGTKSSSQVKSYMSHQKSLGLGWIGKNSVSSSTVGVDGMDFNFTEIIHDIEIPASMEEVIAVVSTAQPTVILPTSNRESSSTSNSSLIRKKCRRRKHSKSCSKKSQAPVSDFKDVARIYKAEDIKDVLTGNKEQDSIVLPTGEQVIRIRHESNVSEDGEVDIDVNSEPDTKESIDIKIPVENKNSQPLTKETIDPVAESSEEVKEEVFEFEEDAIIDFSDIKDELFLPDVATEVSVFTEGFIGEKPTPDVETDTQVFKGNLVTPSGKVMTVIVDDLPNARYNNVANEKSQDSAPLATQDPLLDAVYDLPPPTCEAVLQTFIVTKEEQLLHPEFFDKNFHGLSRYMKIRNHINECWMNSKPKYVSNTSVLASPSFSEDDLKDTILIKRIHAYLERKGYINYGCEHSHYNNSVGSDVVLEDFSDQVCSIVEVDSCSVETDDVTEHSVSSIEHASSINKEEEPAMEKVKHVGNSRVRKKKVVEQGCEKIRKTSNPTVQKPGSRSKNTSKKPRKQSSRLSPLWRPNKTVNNNSEGYTMMHTTTGEVIVQHNQKRQTNKMLTRGIRPVRLIHCKNYVSRKAPYKVELEVTVLLLVDIHSHLSPKCEVIGLLGGSHRTSDNVLTITMAVPCRTVLSSNIHCDMCPG